MAENSYNTNTINITIPHSSDANALLTGNEAIALGAYKAGVYVAVGYPGTPSSEILPFLAKFKSAIVNWSINEKTALEIAVGASIGFKRSMFTTKHVGLNVASDPLMTLALTGVRGGLVVVTADDPGMHSSQNEQDNRMYAKFAKIPMLEPSDSEECLNFTEIAFDISEKFDTPVILRTTTRISHSRSIVSLPDIPGTAESIKSAERHINKPYIKDIEKFVMAPVYAKKRHKSAIKRLEYLTDFSNNSGINKIEYNSRDLGIITSGISYQYAKEIAPSASFLKLSFSYPVPNILVKEFVKNIKNVVIIEELEPFIQNEISSFGINLKGKEYFPRDGELNLDLVKRGLTEAGFLTTPQNIHENIHESISEALPPRLPALCSGCPHTSVFYALKKLKVPVMGDIGCYTLGALPPLNAMDSCISMGLAFGAAQGLSLSKSSVKKTVGIMGDSTFFHSGITSLIDAKYNNACFTAIILDNATTAMTGGQDHPGTGKNLSLNQSVSSKIDIKKIIEGIGIDEIYIIDPYDYNETYKILKKAVQSENLNVVITNRPCVLYPKKLNCGIKFKVIEGCLGCDLCMQIGCPSILPSSCFNLSCDKRLPTIDDSCIGCSICKDICIFNFISEI
ncbi:MAG: indolepyruvate ferredoxin oxidoreductase subunit alpha [Deltaproteobacteria bacterium]|nr:indolepyruvate ferredoxin oxidoreductase subunit alpha [Deltaproteobacteria bacterium]